MEWLFVVFPISFILFPLVAALVFVSLQGASTLPTSEEPAKAYSVKPWFVADAIFVLIWAPLIWLPDTEFGHRLFHQSSGEATSAIVFFVGVPVVLALPIVGILQPFWRGPGAKLKHIPFAIFIGAALAVPSIYICNIFWPIGYLFIAPLTGFLVVFLVYRLLKRKK